MDTLRYHFQIKDSLSKIKEIYKKLQGMNSGVYTENINIDTKLNELNK